MATAGGIAANIRDPGSTRARGRGGDVAGRRRKQAHALIGRGRRVSRRSRPWRFRNGALGRRRRDELGPGSINVGRVPYRSSTGLLHRGCDHVSARRRKSRCGSRRAGAPSPHGAASWSSTEMPNAAISSRAPGLGRDRPAGVLGLRRDPSGRSPRVSRASRLVHRRAAAIGISSDRAACSAPLRRRSDDPRDPRMDGGGRSRTSVLFLDVLWANGLVAGAWLGVAVSRPACRSRSPRRRCTRSDLVVVRESRPPRLPLPGARWVPDARPARPVAAVWSSRSRPRSRVYPPRGPGTAREQVGSTVVALGCLAVGAGGSI